MFYPILIHSRHSEPPQGSFGGHDGFISQPLTGAAPGCGLDAQVDSIAASTGALLEADQGRIRRYPLDCDLDVDNAG